MGHQRSSESSLACDGHHRDEPHVQSRRHLAPFALARRVPEPVPSSLGSTPLSRPRAHRLHLRAHRRGRPTRSTDRHPARGIRREVMRARPACKLPEGDPRDPGHPGRTRTPARLFRGRPREPARDCH